MELKQTTAVLQTTLVVIGDSWLELEAGHALSVCSNTYRTTLKTIKLISEPSANQLVEQLQVINAQWNSLMRTRSGIEARLEFA